MKQATMALLVAVSALILGGCASRVDIVEAPVRLSEGVAALETLAQSVSLLLPPGESAAAIVRVGSGAPSYAFAGNLDVGRQTAFEFASVTKVMTAALLSTLAAAQAIDLDAAVTQYLGTDGLDDRWSTVTARHLLTHTAGLSGFPPNLNPAWIWLTGRANDPFAGYTSPRLAAGIRRSRPDPQNEWDYSNYGFAVLGYLAERRTGLGYAQLLEERILAPAGMHDAAVDRWSVLDVAPPLSRSGRNANAFQFDAMAPAGAVRGTIEDAAAFLSAALGACETDEPLGRALCETFVPQRGEEEWPYEMGLGWFRSDAGGATVVWHNGGTAGSSSFLGFAEESGVGLAVLSNVAGLREIDGLGLSFLSEVEAR